MPICLISIIRGISSVNENHDFVQVQSGQICIVRGPALVESQRNKLTLLTPNELKICLRKLQMDPPPGKNSTKKTITVEFDANPQSPWKLLRVTAPQPPQPGPAPATGAGDSDGKEAAAEHAEGQAEAQANGGLVDGNVKWRCLMAVHGLGEAVAIDLDPS
jgi:hypothetical protein